MHLDIVTPMTAGSFVAALGGLLLTGAWTQIRREPAEERLAQMERGRPELLEVAPDAGMNEGGEIAPSDSSDGGTVGRRHNELFGQKAADIIPDGFAQRLIAVDTRIADEAPSQR